MSGGEHQSQNHNDRLIGVEHGLQELVRALEKQDKDRQDFRERMEGWMKHHHVVLYGDGDSKKGLVTRTVELETANGKRDKLSWVMLASVISLAMKSVWDYFTTSGHKPPTH